MKVRVRKQDGSTIKIDINQTDTLGVLQARIAEACGEGAGHEVVLSLNKKARLCCMRSCNAPVPRMSQRLTLWLSTKF